MLIIVIENPIQLTMVNEVPLDSPGAFCATSVENRGESAITTNPQKKRNAISTERELLNRNRGETQQHKQDKSKEMVAIFFTPNCWERYPLITHARPPEAMIMNDRRGIFKSVF